jgi:excisionase family DNA binding protein
MGNKESKVAFNLKQASEYIGISSPTLLNIVRSGEIPSKKIGKRRWLISKEVIDDWIKGTTTRKDIEKGD